MDTGKLSNYSNVGTFVLTIVILVIMVVPLLRNSDPPPSTQANDPHLSGAPVITWIMPSILALAILGAAALNFATHRHKAFPTRNVEPESEPEPKMIELKGAEGYANALLRNQASEIATRQLDQLTDDAVMLVRLVPKQGANESTAAHIWNAFYSEWRRKVIHALESQWGAKAVEFFASADGFNKDEAVGNVLQDAANPYRELLHDQRNLKNLRLNR